MPAATLSRADEKSARKTPERPTNVQPDRKTNPDQPILYQSYFRSVGTRTYAAQVKKAGNGNHFIVLTEGRRDEKTGEIRKTRLLVFSEDFEAFAKLFADTMKFVREHPVPDEIAKKQERFWKKKQNDERQGAKSTR